jgi:crotonobetainyl-CoA:carnitine CoA-transferase CaiB-like acyl-CoA transferase
VEHKFIENFLNGVGRPDLIAAALGPVGPGQEPVKAALREVFLGRSRRDWERFAAEHDVALAPVLDLKEAFDHPNTAARGMLIRDAEGTPHIGTPFRFRNEPGQPNLTLPDLDQHRGQRFGATRR